MGKKSCQAQPPRIPLPEKGIQVNGCKNPTCDAFVSLMPPLEDSGEPNIDDESYQRNRGHYRISGRGKGVSSLICLRCEENKKNRVLIGSVSSSLKSNKGVVEELDRISGHLDPSPIRCPNLDCESNAGAAPLSIKRNGKTTSGNQRLKCLVCGKGFTSRPKTRKHTKSHIEKLLFKLLISKVPLRRIIFLCDVSPKTVYDKIRFIYKQCQAFSAARERELENKAYRRMYLCTDRQVLISNWIGRYDKRNCEIYGIATACADSGYVFAFNFNFDGSVDSNDIERSAIEAGDYDVLSHHRKYARVWLKQEFEQAIRGSKSKRSKAASDNLRDEIKEQAVLDEQDRSNDSSEDFNNNNALPSKGVLIHNEYTMLAHFFLMKRFFRSTEKTRFFMDLDSGMKSAYLSAFREEIAQGNSDGFLVRASKNKTVDEKERLVAEFKRLISDRLGIPIRKLTYQDIILTSAMIIEERIKAPIVINNSPEQWIEHPVATMAEPEKMVAAITDVERLDTRHQAHLYRMATLAPVDRFFMRIRRFSTMFERPFASGSNKGRTWYGYAAYNPEMYTMIGEIFRVYYNYCSEKKNSITPAMKLGIAKGVVDIEKIIYFNRC